MLVWVKDGCKFVIWNMKSYISQDVFTKQYLEYLEQKDLNTGNWLCRWEKNWEAKNW